MSIDLDTLQRELDEKERRLQAFSEAPFEAIFLSEKGICLDQNMTAEKMFGYSREEALGRPGTEWIVPEDRETVMNHMLSGFEGPYEVRALRKDGSLFPCEIRAKMIEQLDGKKLRVTSLMDITQRKTAEKSRQESEERFKRLAENAPDLIYRMSLPERRYEYLSPAALEISGYPPEAFLEDASLFLKVVDPRDIDYIMEQRDKLIAGEVPPVFEFRIIHAVTGETRWIHQRNVLVHDEDGNPTAIEGIATDVTKLREAEAERLNLERQVQHAQKLESLGVLAGGIAHDFNNILMSILGNVDLLDSTLPADGDAREHLDEIGLAARSAAELSNQMLAYSGRGRFEIGSLDLNELIEDLAPLLYAAVSKQAKLQLELSPMALKLLGDKTQLRQVVFNLITNASEALGDAGGSIVCETGIMECDRATLTKAASPLGQDALNDLEEGEYGFIEVRDDGNGMDAITRQKIFDPFFSTKFTGRGLGMSVVQGIVRGHRGGILLDSKPGVGTRFRILLPLPEAQDDASVAAATEVDPDRAWRGEGAILLVDDEESVRRVGGRMIEHLGFTPFFASQGREALAILEQHADEIRVVLLDLTMPGMDGIATIEEIEKAGLEVPVILCSGYTEKESIRNFKGKGLAGFIQKPYGLDTLSLSLQRLLHDEGERG